MTVHQLQHYLATMDSRIQALGPRLDHLNHEGGQVGRDARPGPPDPAQAYAQGWEHASRDPDGLPGWDAQRPMAPPTYAVGAEVPTANTWGEGGMYVPREQSGLAQPAYDHIAAAARQPSAPMMQPQTMPMMQPQTMPM